MDWSPLAGRFHLLVLKHWLHSLIESSRIHCDSKYPESDLGARLDVGHTEVKPAFRGCMIETITTELTAVAVMRLIEAFEHCSGCARIVQHGRQVPRVKTTVKAHTCLLNCQFDLAQARLELERR